MRKLYIKPQIESIDYHIDRHLCSGSDTTRVIDDGEGGGGSQTIGGDQPNPGMDAKDNDFPRSYNPWED